MFTGIVSQVGVIQEMTATALTIDVAGPDYADVVLGESISVNGVCLTVVSNEAKHPQHRFTFNLSPETLAKTTFSSCKVGDSVNLERALRPSDRLSGHWVQGHIDGIGTVLEILQGDYWKFKIRLPEGPVAAIEKGSIAVHGVSLTINRLKSSEIELMIIPHTLRETNLQFLHVGSMVNIEYDILCKTVIAHLSKSVVPRDSQNTAEGTLCN